MSQKLTLRGTKSKLKIFRIEPKLSKLTDQQIYKKFRKNDVSSRTDQQIYKKFRKNDVSSRTGGIPIFV